MFMPKPLVSEFPLGPQAARCVPLNIEIRGAGGVGKTCVKFRGELATATTATSTATATSSAAAATAAATMTAATSHGRTGGAGGPRAHGPRAIAPGVEAAGHFRFLGASALQSPFGAVDSPLLCLNAPSCGG